MKKIFYSNFGNTSLRVKNLLYNLESQLLLFQELFAEATLSDTWTNGSELQKKYLNKLYTTGLLISKTKNNMGTKDARVKSSPLEDLNLVRRESKKITALGEELLVLLNTNLFKENNDFLQIDLVSLFFLKSFFQYTKKVNHSLDNETLFTRYLVAFSDNNYSLNKTQFELLPIICSDLEEYQRYSSDFHNKTLNKDNLILKVLENTDSYKINRNLFIDAILKNNFQEASLILKTAKGIQGGEKVCSLYYLIRDILLGKYDAYVSKAQVSSLNKTLKVYSTEGMKYILSNKPKENLHMVKTFFAYDNEAVFAKLFFDFVHISRVKNNLDDYYDLNRRYLKLTGIFEFYSDSVNIIPTAAILLKALGSSNKWLECFRHLSINRHSLNYLFEKDEVKIGLKEFGLENNTKDLKEYKHKKDKEKMQKLLDERFSKDVLCNKILPLFETRRDSELHKLVCEDATIPTIYEYAVALSWYYIDDKNIDFILNAGLSFDSDMLPKSHAGGGTADLNYDYADHKLLIEVTLTSNTNQRKAEMESVSRHLGKMLASIKDKKIREQSYAIFIAEYLDKNVLNDFRARQNIIWEDKDEIIDGMNILPICTKDLIKILKSSAFYRGELQKIFNDMLSNNEKHGSKWYNETIKSGINTLVISD